MRSAFVIVVMSVLLVVAACGDDDSVATTAAAVTDTTVVATTDTTAAEVVETTAAEASVEGSVPQGAAVTGQGVLLSDDFQDGDASDWDVGYGWFIHGAGTEYVLASSDAAWTWWPEGGSWDAGYVLRASVRVDQGGLGVSVAVGQEGRYLVLFHEGGTDLLVDRPWGTLEPLASGDPVELGAWHGLAFGVDDSELQVYVDGSPWLRHELSDALSGGSVGFGALDGSLVAVDNVVVTVLQRAFPPAAFPEPAPLAVADPGGVVEDPLAEQDDEPPGEEDDEPSGEGAGLPDLVLVGVSFDKARYAPDEPISVRVSGRNDSDGPVGPFSVAWVAGDAGCAVEVDQVAAGEFFSGECTSGGLPEDVTTYQAFVDDDERIDESNEDNNQGSGSIQITSEQAALPNLVVGSFFLDGELADTPFGMFLAVDDANDFGGVIGSYTVRFFLDEELACSIDIVGVGVWSEGCEFPGVAAGPHIIKIDIDADGDIAETRDDDNRYIYPFELAGEAAADAVDLTVPEVVFDPPEPRAGEAFQVTVWVSAWPYQGELPDYTVRWALEDGGVACEWGATIWSGGLSCEWQFDEAGTFNWRARVDATDTVAETDDDNNVLRGSVVVAP